MKIILYIMMSVTLLFGVSIHPSTFESAKEYSERLILSEITKHKITTLYAQVPISYTYKTVIPTFPGKPQIDIILIPIEDRYESTTYETRSHNIEWEHVVPAHWFRTADPLIMEVWDNGHIKCVTSTGTTYKGRGCASKVSEKFNKMESDLYNLEPALGSLNAIRSDYNFGIIEGENRIYGQSIDFEIDKIKDIVEPAENIRGKISRIFIYMNKKYGVTFPNHNTTMELMKEWNNQYPMDLWEIRKREILQKTYGYTF